MIRTLPTSKTYSRCFKLYVVLYFVFLFAPLLVTCVLAFNDSQFPSLPWKGFTLEWFTADLPQRVGIFNDQIIILRKSYRFNSELDYPNPKEKKYK